MGIFGKRVREFDAKKFVLDKANWEELHPNPNGTEKERFCEYMIQTSNISRSQNQLELLNVNSDYYLAFFPSQIDEEKRNQFFELLGNGDEKTGNGYCYVATDIQNDRTLFIVEKNALNRTRIALERNGVGRQ